MYPSSYLHVCLKGSEWETAVRRKHKNSQNTSKGVDSLEDDIKDMSQQPSSRKERTDSKGRGRGRNNKNKSKFCDVDGFNAFAIWFHLIFVKYNADTQQFF